MTPLPRLARVLLRLTDPRVREFATGDLEETYARNLADGEASARRWAMWQAAALVHAHLEETD